MLWKLALLMTVVPAIELFVLILLGTYIGALQTTLIIVVTGLTGAFLAKREGLGVLGSIRADLQKGIPPTGRLAEGVLVFAGGLFLLTPGVFTDITGFLFIIPWSRRLIAPYVSRWAAARLGLDGQNPNFRVHFGEGRPASPDSPNSPENADFPFDHPVS